MSKVNNLTDFLTDVASAIRNKKGYSSTQKINPQNFSSEISSIATAPQYGNFTSVAPIISNDNSYKVQRSSSPVKFLCLTYKSIVIEPNYTATIDINIFNDENQLLYDHTIEMTEDELETLNYVIVVGNKLIVNVDGVSLLERTFSGDMSYITIYFSGGQASSNEIELDLCYC